jgi:uncharacterized protein
VHISTSDKSSTRNILLISDTHSFLDPALDKYFQQADEIWHAGDIGSEELINRIELQAKTNRIVFGNIDNHLIRVRTNEYLIFELAGMKILMIHIAGPFGKYTPQTRQLIKDYQPGILVCGHSHILKVAFDKHHQLLYMNPGACGNHGFHKVRTVLRFQIKEGKPLNLDVIELGSRNLS